MTTASVTELELLVMAPVAMDDDMGSGDDKVADDDAEEPADPLMGDADADADDDKEDEAV